jgi:hypothetical protein
MKNKKIILSSLAIIIIVTFASININLGAKSNELLTISLVNIDALADNTENGNEPCPGKSCSYTNNFGDSCSACCPNRKSASCDQWGCECK